MSGDGVGRGKGKEHRLTPPPTIVSRDHCRPRCRANRVLWRRAAVQLSSRARTPASLLPGWNRFIFLSLLLYTSFTAIVSTAYYIVVQVKRACALATRGRENVKRTTEGSVLFTRDYTDGVSGNAKEINFFTRTRSGSNDWVINR